MINFILSRLSKHNGKTKYQSLFQRIYEAGLYGMNYGNGAEFSESGEMEAIKYAQKKADVRNVFILFDVGANVGNYSRSVSGLFPEGKIVIHLFEPSNKVFQELSQNLAIRKGIFLNNIGLGEDTSTQKLFKNEMSTGLSSLYKRKLDHFNISMEETEQIEITSIDEYCKKNNIDRIDFLKIDVEGHEFGVLAGATDMLKRKKIKFIQFEMGGTNIDSRNYFQDFFYLLKDNYYIYRIIRDGLVRIDNYREEQEIFLGINYLAELK